MADPNIPVHDDDIRYEDRGGCFVLVDPVHPEGRDVAITWPEDAGRWRWRLTRLPATGAPHPAARDRDEALRAMLAAYAGVEPGVQTRLDAQRPRHSFGEPQIFRR